MKRILALVLACILGLSACAASSGAERSVAELALAAPEKQALPQYPQDEDYEKHGTWDNAAYTRDFQAWRAVYAEKTTQLVQAEDMEHWLKTSIPALMQQTGAENCVCSPLNVYMALSMLAAVTDGQTRQQILTSLGADSMDTLRTRAAALYDENTWDDGIITSTLANSFWLRDDREYNAETLAALSEDFSAYVFSGEMGSEAYLSLLRRWLSENTGELLTDQANGLELSPDTVLALVSTLYYSAHWSQEFYDGLNTQELFHAPTGDRTATYMHSSSVGTVYYGDDFMATGLGLRNGGCMWLLKPTNGAQAGELLSSDGALSFLLANGNWSQAQQARIALSLPKFDVSSDLDLLDTLAGLGMTDVLDPALADFSPLMAEKTDGLALTDARHAARVKINEDGCEAAAYTVLTVAETETVAELEVVEFTLDEPFVFAITGVDGLPLFVGLVNQPA